MIGWVWPTCSPSRARHPSSQQPAGREPLLTPEQVTVCGRLVVHFDVDVIDFTDVPLSENWGRNEGVSYKAAIRALRVLLESPKLSELTVTELNPDHVEEGAGTLDRFSRDLAASLAVRERKGADG